MTEAGSVSQSADSRLCPLSLSSHYLAQVWLRPTPFTSPPTLTVPNITTFSLNSSSQMDSTRRLSVIREKETKVSERTSPHENGSPSHSLSPIFFHFPFRHLAVVTVRLSDCFVCHHNHHNNNKNHNNLMIISSSLPCTAFLFCIIYSFFYHYEWVTRTHCQVWNIAPSISGKGVLPLENIGKPLD